VLKAVDQYSAGTADFPDYLILALARAAGAATLLTFDRRLLRHSSCKAP
jgi:predicted nucleic-acid-binding protein